MAAYGSAPLPVAAAAAAAPPPRSRARTAVLLGGAALLAVGLVAGSLPAASPDPFAAYSKAGGEPLNALILGDSITASAGCQMGQNRCEQCKKLKEDGGWVQIFQKLAPDLNLVGIGATGRGALKPEHWEEKEECIVPGAHHQSFWPKLHDSISHHFGGRPDVVFILFGTVRSQTCATQARARSWLCAGGWAAGDGPLSVRVACS